VWCGVLCSAVVVLWRVGLREGETDALSLMSEAYRRDAGQVNLADQFAVLIRKVRDSACSSFM